MRISFSWRQIRSSYVTVSMQLFLNHISMLEEKLKMLVTIHLWQNKKQNKKRKLHKK